MDHLSLVGLYHSQNGTGQGGFTGAGLAHQTQNLAVADIKADIVEDLVIRLFAEHAAFLVAAGHMLHGEDQFLAHTSPSFRLRVGMAAMSRWVYPSVGW